MHPLSHTKALTLSCKVDECKPLIDGCAIFFKKDRFTLIKKYEVEFNKAALSLVESLGAGA